MKTAQTKEANPLERAPGFRDNDSLQIKLNSMLV